MTVSTLTRGQLMDALRGLGVDGPEAATRELQNPAIEGTIKKAQHMARRGKEVGGGLIVYWLRQGGDEGWGTAVELPQEWFRTYAGRLRWITQHVPDLEEDWAEIAVVSLVLEKRTPTPDLVRSFASLAEQHQKAHDGTCRIPLGGERKEHGQTDALTEEGKRGQDGEGEDQASAEEWGDPVGSCA